MKKVKITTATQNEIDRIKEINIAKAKAFVASFPCTNLVHTAIKTKLSIEFLKQNRKEIGL